MSNLKRKLLSVCVIAAIAATALMVPAISSAGQAYPVKFTLVGQSKSTSTVSGTVSATPWGQGTYVSKINFPFATYTLKFAKGTISFKEKGTVQGTTAKSSWTITGGTGKFDGISGGGTGGGSIKGNTFKYVGHAKG